MVGALLDAGAEFAALDRAIAGLGLRGYRISTRPKTSSGIAALKFDVEVHEAAGHRATSWLRFAAMIERAGLTPRATANAIAIFEASRRSRGQGPSHHSRPRPLPRGRRGRFDHRYRRRGVGARPIGYRICWSLRCRWAQVSPDRATASSRCRPPPRRIALRAFRCASATGLRDGDSHRRGDLKTLATTGRGRSRIFEIERSGMVRAPRTSPTAPTCCA